MKMIPNNKTYGLDVVSITRFSRVKMYFQ